MAVPLLVTIPDAAEMLGGCTRAHIYKLVNDGELEIVKLGRSSRIRLADVYRIAGLPLPKEEAA